MDHDTFRVELSVLETETPMIATRDHELIRTWAAHVQAEPSTGEATPSGPATVDVRDGGAGIRFNFPGSSRFRPISWAEWFENFDRHRLVLVYAEGKTAQVQSRAYELWQSRGGGDGHDRDDWLRAEQEIGQEQGAEDARYRLLTSRSIKK